METQNILRHTGAPELSGLVGWLMRRKGAEGQHCRYHRVRLLTAASTPPYGFSTARSCIYAWAVLWRWLEPALLNFSSE